MHRSPGQTVARSGRAWTKTVAALLVAGTTVLGRDVPCSLAEAGPYAFAEVVRRWLSTASS